MKQKLKIGIITDAIDDGGAGIGSYVRNFVETLKKIDKTNQYVLIHNKESDDPIYKLGFEELIIPVPKGPLRRVRRKTLTMPKILQKHNFDIVHELAQIGPNILPTGYKKVVTVHDTIPLIYPETFPENLVYHAKYATPYFLKKADVIISNSENTREDVLRFYPIEEDKIVTIYLGLNEMFGVIKDNKLLQEVKDRLHLPDNFFVSVGTIEPRKNLIKLVEGFKKFKKNDKKNTKLIIVGSSGWLFEKDKLEEKIIELGLENEVRLFGRASDEELVQLYNLATALVFPSLYEGFGFPIIEAQACGCPVITSDVSSMPEVGGEAAIYVSPNSAKEIASAMNEASTSDNKELRKKGLENVKRFSWEKNVRQTIEIYKELME